MTLTPNFNPTESSPEIYIYDYDGVLNYTYQTSKTQTTPTQDFRLTDLTFTIEGNGDYGHAVLLIEDNNNVLIDTTLRRKCKIKREWDIQIKLGKNNAGVQRWFYGKIKSAPILRPGTNLERVQLNCVGWGEILKNKITQIKRNQDKLSNGIDLDPADTKTKLYNLILRMFDSRDHQVDNNIEQISTITAALADQGICSDCLDISVANVNELANTYAGFISRICGIANTDWYIDPDRKIVVRDSVSHDSGFLITNNLTGIDAINWNSTKLMYIKNEPFAWDDSSVDTMYSWVHGLGCFIPILNISETTTPNASDAMYDDWISCTMIPTVDNVFKLGFMLSRTGTPATNSTIQIRGDDGAGKPDLTDIRRTIVITKEILQALPTGTPTKWYEIPVNPKLEINPNETLHIVFPKYGDVSNTFNVGYKSGSGTYHSSAADVTWNNATGKIDYRLYSAKRLKISVENTVLSQKLNEQKEKVLPIRADLEHNTVIQAMFVASEALGKERRTYQNIICTMPEDVIQLASYCRLQDSDTGLDIKANIISYTVEMHAGDSQSNIGATSITLTLDDTHAG